MKGGKGKMIKKVLILDTEGCASCKSAEKLIDKIKKEEKLNFKVEVKNIAKHPEYLEKYQIMISPGIVIDGKLEFTGVPSVEKLRKKLMK